MRILVVEDEKHLNRIISEAVEDEGYSVDSCFNGQEALEFMECAKYDVMILDIMMPKLNGLDLVRRLRRGGDTTPVLFLTARDDMRDKIQGLTVGGDDYVTKPFSAAELLARVRVAIRHTRSGLSNEALVNTGKFVAGDLTIDYDKHQVLIAGENCHLTQNEYRIVALLGKCAGKVLTYDFIMKELWGPQSKGSNQILRVNMANIRRKIEKNPAEPHYIFTEVGVGYRMIEGD